MPAAAQAWNLVEQGTEADKASYGGGRQGEQTRRAMSVVGSMPTMSVWNKMCGNDPYDINGCKYLYNWYVKRNGLQMYKFVLLIISVVVP